MRHHKLIETMLVTSVMALWGGYAHAGEFSARLAGSNETPSAILSNATGTLHLDLDEKAGTLNYTLTYSPGLTSSVLFAHIHFGKVHVTGGVIVFLCNNDSSPPPGPTPPACPSPSGTVSGTLTAANVIGPTGQNVTAGDFDALKDALTSNTAYVNVHTMNFPPGEIRGQIREEKDDE